MTDPDHLTETIARAIEQAHIDHVEAHNAALAKAGLWPDPYASPTRPALAQAIAAALTEAGYAIVPVDPTEAMILDGLKAAGLDGEVYHVDDFQALYRALIAPDHIMPPIQEPGPLEAEEN